MSPMPPPKWAPSAGVRRKVSSTGTRSATCPCRKTRTAPKMSSSKSYSGVPGGDATNAPPSWYEPMTPAARSSAPTRASSCGSRRPGVTALPPAQHAWACARDDQLQARSISGALLRNLECGNRIVLYWPGDGQTQLPEPGHEEVDAGEQVLAVGLGCDGGRHRGAVAHRGHPRLDREHEPVASHAVARARDGELDVVGALLGRLRRGAHGDLELPRLAGHRHEWGRHEARRL